MKKAIKNSIINLIILSIISCNETAKKIDEHSEIEITKSINDLEQAKIKLNEEFEDYKTATIEKLMTNDTILNTYRKKVADEKLATKKINEKKIHTLEEKNIELKNRIKSYIIEDEAEYLRFKTQCEKDVKCVIMDMNTLYKFE